MKSASLFVFVVLLGASRAAEPSTVSLPPITVYSPHVANQKPVGSFAMPVSTLQFEPRVDLQARNLAEAQADVAIRGGTFETTGFRLGALDLYDPQTGHYLAELPVAPEMLGAPDVLTGADHAATGWNATSGSIVYGWRPVQTAGVLTLGGGQSRTYQAELYQGVRSDERIGSQQLSADAAVASSGSNGPLAFGESRFSRANARVQLSGEKSQTDLVYGYQEKFFGWPNLYTPFNSDETENLQTAIAALNHRVELAEGGYVEIGAYWRRNKDDYAFNRFAPLGSVHPFQHTTRVFGTTLDGRTVRGDWALGYRAGLMHDDLQSTSLLFGRFHSRTFTTAGLYPEKRWKLEDGSHLVVRAGAGFDDTNRDGSAVSPLLTIAREIAGPKERWSRLYFSYAKTTQEPSYTALNSSAAAGLFRGNPNLGRSASHNLELGANGTWFGWEASAAVFYRRDDRLVDWTFRQGVTARSANAVDIATTGAEVFARRTYGKVDLVLGYTAMSKDADYRGAVVDASFYALNYPKHRLTAAVTARLGAGWELRLDNDLRLQASNPLRVTGGSRPVLSTLGVFYRPAPLPALTLSVQVGNLWNSSFQTVPGVPASSRQIMGSASYVW